MTFSLSKALSNFVVLVAGVLPLSVLGAPVCSEMDIDAAPVAGVLKASAGFVTSGLSQHLRHDPAVACPSDSAPSDICRQEIRGGLQGVALNRAPGWVCIVLPGGHKLDVVVGWLRESRWHPISDSRTASAHAWAGVWQNERGRLNIVVDGASRVHIDGHAMWQGRADPHFGDVTFDGIPDNGVLAGPGDQDSCQIALRKIGKYIFAQDNDHCGGTNVRFSGLYRLRRGL